MDVQEAVAELLAALQDYEVPLNSGDKPREKDVVRLLKPLPANNLPAGSTGTVVVDYSEYSGEELPQEYEVAFGNIDSSTSTLVTLCGDDLELVSRPGYGRSPS